MEDFFRNAADEFSNVFDLDEAELDARIRADEIDILIDFMRQMPGNRLMTYDRKPAPLILSWFGLGTATGIDAVDYFVADAAYVPPDSIENYVENIVFLDGLSIIWRPPAQCPEVAPAPCLLNGEIRFCNINRTVKLQERTLQLFAKVLAAVPNSTMTFKDTMIDDGARKWLSAPFLAAGIAAERLIFFGKTSHYDHLVTYNQTDIARDGFPQQGGISSLEALWMGNPVINYSESVRPAARAGPAHGFWN